MSRDAHVSGRGVSNGSRSVLLNIDDIDPPDTRRTAAQASGGAAPLLTALRDELADSGQSSVAADRSTSRGPVDLREIAQRSPRAAPTACDRRSREKVAHEHSRGERACIARCVGVCCDSEPHDQVCVVLPAAEHFLRIGQHWYRPSITAALRQVSQCDRPVTGLLDLLAKFVPLRGVGSAAETVRATRERPE